MAYFPVPITFMAASGASRTYITTVVSAFGSATSFTFNSVSLGTALGTSLVVCEVHAWDSVGSGRALNTVTIGGTSATINVSTIGVISAAAEAHCAIVSATQAASSGNIVVTYSNTVLQCIVDVYRLNNLVSSSVNATASANGNVSSLSTTINIPGAGALFEAVTLFSSGSNSSISASGTSLDHTQQGGQANIVSWAGSIDGLASQSGRTLSETNSSGIGLSSGATALVGAVWQ